MSDIILNESQKKAVEHDEGPLLIIAGAGTGKTRVITERIAHLVNTQKADSDEILALTFTQKAAQEMEERVDIAMPYGYSNVWISTFHAFCDQILRQEGIHIGLDPDYVLMSGAQEYLYFRNNLFDFDIEKLRPHGNPTKFISAMLGHFSRLGDEDVSVDEYEEFVKSFGDTSADTGNSDKDGKEVPSEAKKDLQDQYEELFKVYKDYYELKQKDSRLSFCDLVPLTIKLFRENESVLERYREKFKYVLVDEFQDTNYSQNELLKVLVPQKGNITVVGDDDQAIYKFRGAAISNILDFKKSFPSYEKIVLTKNYRSCQEILDAAYNLIQNNNPDRLEIQEEIDKKLERVFPTDDAVGKIDGQIGLDLDRVDDEEQSESSECAHDAVRRIHAENDVDEAELVVSEIERLVEDEGLDFSDIAVLVRANNHADQFISSFRYHGVPFIFPGPKGLYNRPEIKDLIALLRIIVDYKDDSSMYRILTFSSGLESEELEKSRREEDASRNMGQISDTRRNKKKKKGEGLTAREFIDVQRLSKQKHISIFELLEDIVGHKIGSQDQESSESLPKNEEEIQEQRELFDKLFSKKSQLWIEKLLGAYDQAFAAAKNGKPVGEVLYGLLDRLGYLEVLANKKSVRDEWRIQNISKFFNHLKSFEKEAENGSVFEFMEYLDYALEIGESPTVDPVDMVDFDAVNVSTVHGSKGLEFPVVFMVNLVSSRFPTRNRSDTLPIPEELIKETLPEGDEHTQEERRLFYVGMTRAKRFLYLTSADYYGDGIRKKKQSVFLHDLDLVEKAPLEAKGQKGDIDSIPNIIMPKDGDVLPENFRRSKLDNIVRNLSYSHVSTYQTCPYQFYFKYFLGIPGAESQARSFGMTMHNTLKAFYERVKRYKQGLPEVNELPDIDDLLNIYESKWISQGYEGKKQEISRFKAGEQSLRRYYEQFFSEDENPIWLEERFQINMKDFWIKGVVDRLDRRRIGGEGDGQEGEGDLGGGLEIIDYKTGKVPSRSVKKNLQLALYAMAIERIKDEEVKKASLLYLSGPKKFEVDISKDRRKEAEEEVKEVLEELKKLNFKPDPGFLCRYCDYRNICDFADI